MKKLCPICGSDHIDPLITLDSIPYFDNCLCESELLAVQAGCGTGEFLQVVAKYEPQMCIGVDPSADEMRGNVTIHCRLFNEEYLTQYPAPVDILVSRHMIEHMEDRSGGCNVREGSVYIG